MLRLSRKPKIRIKKLFQPSALNTTESFKALYVINTATGVIIPIAASFPNQTDHDPCRAMRKPEVSTIRYRMKTSTDIITGNPSPPLRIIVPKGAPMKKNSRHCRASVNLLMASIWCRRRIFSESLVIKALNSRSLFSCCTLLSAVDRINCLSSAFFFLKISSMLNPFLSAIFMAFKESR